VAAQAEGTFDGMLSPLAGGDQTQARFKISGLPEQAPVRVDALWRGSVVARSGEGGEPITSVVTHWPSLADVDTAVAAANGGVLPADPTALETARRAALIQEVQSTLDQPDAFGDAALDAWLARIDAASVGVLLEHFA